MQAKVMDMKIRFSKLNENSQFQNEKKKAITKSKKIMFSLVRFLILLGISFVILGPLITIVSHSFFSSTDVYNPSAYLIPLKGTLENYSLVFKRLSYVKTLSSTMIYVITLMGLQILICSMVGYGFARFDFPLKKLLFACVIITIVIPTHTIMLPLYMEFRNFDVFGLKELFTGSAVNLLTTKKPMYILTLFGCGLRSGLYIYIFNQFFRGLPKEIEEAAFIDGAGSFYTYLRIMLVNAKPAVITVAVFSLVWQYNDMFYCKLFSLNAKSLMSLSVSTVQATIEFVDKVKDPMISQLYLNAGIVLTIIPILVVYVVLQRYFIEGVERSGIVG
ncbi:carbohydrate ABC transporter permease [Anaeromicropila populeti]|uniref:Multiple sugar transport system permease protein n=1 Tax=Anaeromicropila populeti TaxID=37658 RepID=A0A1I6LKD4_9FIRM|nr:carbohydrate ABC transporter permease [Anaeromicropila populeti]SFS03742.1 multiple sugar transport system permease protein [Anaeromicropila populeti]